MPSFAVAWENEQAIGGRSSALQYLNSLIGKRRGVRVTVFRFRYAPLLHFEIDFVPSHRQQI